MTNRKKSVFSVTAVLGAVLTTALLLTGCAEENNRGEGDRHRDSRNDPWGTGPRVGQGLEIKRAKGTSEYGDEVRIFLYSTDASNGGGNGGVYPRNGYQNQGYHNQNYDPQYGQNYDPRFGRNNHIPNTVGPVIVQASAIFSNSINLNSGSGDIYGFDYRYSYGRQYENNPCYIRPEVLVNFELGQVGVNGQVNRNSQYNLPHFDGYGLDGDFTLVGRGAGMTLEMRPARHQPLYYGMGNSIQISNSALTGQPTLFGVFEVRRIDRGQFCEPKRVSLYDRY